MSKQLADQIRGNMAKRETDDLVQIWTQHNPEEFSEETFEAIQSILEERGVPISPASTVQPTHPEPNLPQDLLPRCGLAGLAVYGIFEISAFLSLLSSVLVLAIWAALAIYMHSAKGSGAAACIAIGSCIGLYILSRVLRAAAKSLRYGGDFWRTVAVIFVAMQLLTFFPKTFVHRAEGDGWYLDMFLIGRTWLLPWPAAVVHLAGIALIMGIFLAAMLGGRSLHSEPRKGNAGSLGVLLGLGLIVGRIILEIASRAVACGN
jgi:hypothetical protein